MTENETNYKWVKMGHTAHSKTHARRGVIGRGGRGEPDLWVVTIHVKLH